jgi:hypothetical protein
MKDLEEQHVCMKLAETFTKTFQMLKQVNGKDSLSRTQCYPVWYVNLRPQYRAVKNGVTIMIDIRSLNSSNNPQQIRTVKIKATGPFYDVILDIILKAWS